MIVKILTFEFAPNGDANIELNFERERGEYPNNVTMNESIPEEIADRLTIDEIQTLALLKSKAKAIAVFEVIEPIDEDCHADNFNIVPSKIVKMEIVGPSTMFIGQTYHLQRVATDQYGHSEYDLIEIKADTLGTFHYEKFEYTVVEPPTPEISIEDYLVDIDYRLCVQEMGV